MTSGSVHQTVHHWWEQMIHLTNHRLGYIITALLTIVVAYSFRRPGSRLSKVPLINPRPRLSVTNHEVKVRTWPSTLTYRKAYLEHDVFQKAFMQTARELMSKARILYADQPYRLNTDLGQVIVLPSYLAEELKNSPALSLATANQDDFHGDIPGFELSKVGTADDILVQTIVRKQLTKNLGMSKEILNKQLSASKTWTMISDPYGTYFAGGITEPAKYSRFEGWTELTVRPVMLDIVARSGARAFLGNTLSENEDWKRVTKLYVVSLFNAAVVLRLYPKPLRRFVHWFLPQCKALRHEAAEAKRIIEPIIQQRREAKTTAEREGRVVTEYNDAIDWTEREATSKNMTYDAALLQIKLSVASSHSTTDLLTQVVLVLGEHPELFEPLRVEIIDALRTDGWKKASIAKLQLMDSVIKECQRIKPGALTTMRRRVERRIQLSNGLLLQPGDRVTFESAFRMWDSNVHERAEQWDPYRFLRMRSQPGKESLAPLEAVSSDHMAFGYGQHACPGRFFAANQIKISLCHLLIKYD
ncbi:hypothetical protein TruAng_001125 [Truncatella angustata]|nr:hypothetical protein TruAng_001125 [Truncatella angustata]